MLHEAWPGLTYHFGLFPDDAGRFSRSEWNGYLFALEAINAEAKKTK